MERKLSRRKMLRRKYKHYAAALAGAAIMTGAAIPGIPAATTFAAENPSNSHFVKLEQAMADSNAGSKASASYDTRYNDSSRYSTRSEGGSHYDSRYHNTNNNTVTRANDTNTNVTYADRNNASASYDTRSDNSNGKYDSRYSHRDGKYDTRYHNRSGWHRHDHSWPSSDDNRGLYKDGKIYYSSDSSRYNNYYDYGNYLTNPITFAKDHASGYGFDANRDTFSLLFQSSRQASIQVIKHDTNQRFKIDLVRSQGADWSIAGVRAV